MKPFSLILILAAGCLPPAGMVAAAAVDSPGPVAELAAWLKQPREHRIPLTNAPFARQSLSRTDAAAAQQLLWEDHAREIRVTRAAEMAAKVINIDKRRMRFDTVSFGDTNKLPEVGRSLFLSMHGGGGAPASVCHRCPKTIQGAGPDDHARASTRGDPATPATRARWRRSA